MVKPRCGFYITEKFPKAPVRTDGGGWEVVIPEGAIVVYDQREFLSSSEEELRKYCMELIEAYGLSFEPEDIENMVAFECLKRSLPEDPEKAKRALKNNPHVEIELDTDDA